jgi:single-strand DNA-binding protein
MSVNKAILVGNVGKDPEIRHLEGGTSVARFTLATSETYKNKTGELITNTEWHNIVAWRQLADVAEKFIKKGKQIYVEGKITNRQYDDKDGNKRYITEIVADNIRLLGRKDENEGSRENAAQRYATEAPAHSAADEVIQPAESDDLPF